MKTKYLVFMDAGLSPSGKTKQWDVLNKSSGARLGWIEWYSPWRQYCYTAGCNAVFYNNRCLRDIAEFLEEQMRARSKTPPEETP